jgi:hypothetical protein
MGAQPGADRAEGLTCTTVTKAGTRCRGYRQAGSELCRLHSPEGQADRAKGLAAARALRAEDAQRLKLETAEDVRRLIEETAQKLRAGTIHAGAAVALDRLARTALASIDSALLAEAQAEIAASKGARPAGVRRR